MQLTDYEQKVSDSFTEQGASPDVFDRWVKQYRQKSGKAGTEQEKTVPKTEEPKIDSFKGGITGGISDIGNVIPKQEKQPLDSQKTPELGISIREDIKTPGDDVISSKIDSKTEETPNFFAKPEGEMVSQEDQSFMEEPKAEIAGEEDSFLGRSFDKIKDAFSGAPESFNKIEESIKDMDEGLKGGFNTDAIGKYIKGTGNLALNVIDLGLDTAMGLVGAGTSIGADIVEEVPVLGAPIKDFKEGMKLGVEKEMLVKRLNDIKIENKAETNGLIIADNESKIKQLEDEINKLDVDIDGIAENLGAITPEVALMLGNAIGSAKEINKEVEKAIGDKAGQGWADLYNVGTHALGTTANLLLSKGTLKGTKKILEGGLSKGRIFTTPKYKGKLKDVASKKLKSAEDNINKILKPGTRDKDIVKSLTKYIDKNVKNYSELKNSFKKSFDTVKNKYKKFSIADDIDVKNNQDISSIYNYALSTKTDVHSAIKELPSYKESLSELKNIGKKIKNGKVSLDDLQDLKLYLDEGKDIYGAGGALKKVKGASDIDSSRKYIKNLIEERGKNIGLDVAELNSDYYSLKQAIRAIDDIEYAISLGEKADSRIVEWLKKVSPITTSKTGVKEVNRLERDFPKIFKKISKNIESSRKTQIKSDRSTLVTKIKDKINKSKLKTEEKEKAIKELSGLSDKQLERKLTAGEELERELKQIGSEIKPKLKKQNKLKSKK